MRAVSLGVALLFTSGALAQEAPTLMELQQANQFVATELGQTKITLAVMYARVQILQAKIKELEDAKQKPCSSSPDGGSSPQPSVR
jgi:hypothetical protein